MRLKKDIKNKKQNSVCEDQVWLFKELGVYSDDSVIDKKINDELLKFLNKLDVKLAEIRFKK